MAAKSDVPIETEKGKELCRVRDKKGILRGFRKDLLTEDLSEGYYAFLICFRCEGILREACISGTGEPFCLCCRNAKESTHPNIQVRSTVLSLKSSCPNNKRGCKWVGNLGDCEKHLEVCGYVNEKCNLGCGLVFQRDELRIHSKEKCVHRIVACVHCDDEFKHCNLPTHHSRCDKMPVKCKLGCDKLVFRKNSVDHTVTECVERKIDCPFVQYSCKVGLIKSKELDQHLEDKKFEHMAMKVNSLEETVTKQNEIIIQLSDKMEALFDPDKYNRALWNVEGIQSILENKGDDTIISEEYVFCGFPMIFMLTISQKITLHFRIESRRSIFPINSRRGHFITRLVCQNDTEGTLEFKSQPFSIGQPVDVLQKMRHYTKGEMATFKRELIVTEFIRDGGIELKITFETLQVHT